MRAKLLSPSPYPEDKQIFKRGIVYPYNYITKSDSIYCDNWIAPGNHGPGPELIGRLCEPLLRPVRRVVPPIGGLDLSALFVMIGLQALQILLR